MATHFNILAWKIPMDRGAWQAIIHGSNNKSDTTEQLTHTHTHTHTRAHTYVKKLIQIDLYLDMLSVAKLESLWSKHYIYHMAACSVDLNNAVDKSIIF